jgi:signal transduction histidine kinase
VLLAKTLRSRTFRLALIFIGLFGAIVLALLTYIYWSSTTYVLDQAGRARNIGDLALFIERIRIGFAAVIALIILLAAFASVAVTRRTVGRIEAINVTSLEIMKSGPNRRIPLRGSRDEWDKLAENLNQMLDRIEILMHEVKEVTDNVAHDLRTPLTRMHGRLERAYHRQRDANEDQALIGDTMADLDDVLRIFSSLMRISQIEASDRKAAFRAVDLGELAREVVELFDAATEEKSVSLSATGADLIFVTGDRDLLFDALSNLVDNAINHGNEGGKVTVDISVRAGAPLLTVSDNGPGIPVDQRLLVFKRFYRLEQSRCARGNGLGLSLVEAVARLHGAHIALADNAPGLKFEMQFPATPMGKEPSARIS